MERRTYNVLSQISTRFYENGISFSTIEIDVDAATCEADFKRAFVAQVLDADLYEDGEDLTAEVTTRFTSDNEPILVVEDIDNNFHFFAESKRVVALGYAEWLESVASGDDE